MDFLELEEVMAAHRRGLERHGGMPGVRDPGLVESAMAAARNAVVYGGGDEFAAAAAYAFHLAQAQAFIDGNKRIGVVAAIMFLARNGWAVAPEAAGRLYDAMTGIAEHRFTKADLAKLFREVCSPVR